MKNKTRLPNSNGRKKKIYSPFLSHSNSWYLHPFCKDISFIAQSSPHPPNPNNAHDKKNLGFLDRRPVLSGREKPTPSSQTQEMQFFCFLRYTPQKQHSSLAAWKILHPMKLDTNHLLEKPQAGNASWQHPMLWDFPTYTWNMNYDFSPSCNYFSIIVVLLF